MEGKVVTGSNIERMKNGLAPIGIDGNSINLHHMIQMQDAGIMEMTTTFHQLNTKTIHINPNTIPTGINRTQFRTWKSEYWKNRVKDLIK